MTMTIKRKQGMFAVAFLLAVLMMMSSITVMAEQTTTDTVSDQALAQAGGTDNPVMRYMSLKSGVVNMRSGPGKQYPILWVYRHRGWPVKILHEFGNWRKVIDADGVEGWIHRNLLSARHQVLLQGEGHQFLRRKPEDDAAPLAELEAGVSARLERCDTQWCRVNIAGYRGWLRRAGLWGVQN